MAEKAETKFESKQKHSQYSGFGTYTITDTLELSLPKTEITITHESDNKFSYRRKNSDDQITNKLVSSNSNSLKIELAPILPLNLPAKKTNDLMFLRLQKQVFVGKKSKLDILVQFPIEIGVFVVDDSGSFDFFDCFTCEPMHSRFALYGTPEKGNLCMYSKVEILDKHEPQDYVYAIIKITIDNPLDKGVKVGKFVFPVTYHDIYYKDGSSESHIDDIEMQIDEQILGKVAKISHVTFKNKDQNLKLAPRSTEKTEKLEFLMDRGFD
ncbi:MAG TPA: DUF432 domain-containing protein [Nitrosopumilaceae archaeon]|nr:DUF432 domain-containing protein [Nitrosopumilaceae archaeon]